jgi:hypothetical protein
MSRVFLAQRVSANSLYSSIIRVQVGDVRLFVEVAGLTWLLEASYGAVASQTGNDGTRVFNGVAIASGVPWVAGCTSSAMLLAERYSPCSGRVLPGVCNGLHTAPTQPPSAWVPLPRGEVYGRRLRKATATTTRTTITAAANPSRITLGRMTESKPFSDASTR